MKEITILFLIITTIVMGSIYTFNYLEKTSTNLINKRLTQN